MKNFKNFITHLHDYTICQYIMGIGCIISLIMAISALYVPFVRDSAYVPHIAIILFAYILYAIYYIVCFEIDGFHTKKQETINLISTIFSLKKIDNIPINKAHKTQIRGALKDIIGMHSNKECHSLEEDINSYVMVVNCELAIDNLRYL